MIARRVVVHGRVQGVGYRFAMVEAASAVGATGWVRNRRNGTVEALVQGDAAAVDALVAWCRRGPPAARVTDVTIEACEPDSRAAGFTQTATA